MKRWGRALQPHPEPIWLDDVVDDQGEPDVLLSRQAIAELTGRHVDVIRKRVPAYACHVPTRATLISRRQAREALAAIPQRRKADDWH